jgi:nitrate/nitrite-specific signal transduction histidine kinase
LKQQKRSAEALEHGVAERTAELLPLKDELAAELAAMKELHALSTRLLAKTDLQSLLDEILSATIVLQNADFGNIQLYNPQNTSAGDRGTSRFPAGLPRSLR